MNRMSRISLRPLARLMPLALAFTLMACGDDIMVAPAPTPTPSPTPTPTSTAVSYNVSNCLNQAIPGTGGLTVAGAVVPDTLKLNLGANSGFPNGRLLSDQVIDITLAVIFLDLTRHSPNTLASLPLNPATNDRPLSTTFPFLAPPQGTPPVAPSTATSFTFRNNGLQDYVRVDRAGMPAVATALIGGPLKNAYNDANPSDDAAAQFVPELSAQLTGLTNALADDLIAAGLTPCATRN